MSDPDPQSRTAAPTIPFAPAPIVDEAKADGTASQPRWFERLKEAFGRRGAATAREDVEQALSETEALDSFSPGERAMIRNILALRETRVDDVMVPRADIEAVEVGATLGALLAAFQRTEHSRIPVYRETLDDPAGMVHIKDLMLYIARRAVAEAAGNGGVDLARVDLGTRIADTRLVRPVLFVPPSMPATELLTKMQTARIQLALVIDEYGGTDGLVSLEDLVETIVGDIEDEHDDEEAPRIVEMGEGVFVADARVPLEEVEAQFGPAFRAADYDEEVETLGGLFSLLLGHIPARGEVLTFPELPGVEVTVLDADPRRLKRVRIRVLPPVAAEVPASAEESGRAGLKGPVPASGA